MKYLINNETKEHRVLTDTTMWRQSNKDWTFVEADNEGWIKHTGTECPLPEDARCEILLKDGTKKVIAANRYFWTYIDLYRPIIEPVQEPEKKTQLTTSTIDLIGTLKRAHEHAQQIPDLEAELREVLGSMGYDLVARSPFVEPEAQGEQP